DGNFILQQEVKDNEPVAVEIWDAVGRSVYKDRLQFTEATSILRMKSLASGLYLLQLTDSKERMFKFKFVVE
ncbi:MAG: T9SS type A sorting domain-containing protein, partial [Legionellales bacterium]